jgi:hypothetical protein
MATPWPVCIAPASLTAIYIPTPDDEAPRDLVRAREDAVGLSTQAKHRLKAFLLRQGRRYPGRAGWTRQYHRWLADLSFPVAPQHIALQEYRDTIDETERRVERLTDQLRQLTPARRWAPVVDALQALRGISFVTAVGLVTEIGDIRRFTHPRQLMAYLGLVPSEYASGPSVRRGGNHEGGQWEVSILVDGPADACDLTFVAPYCNPINHEYPLSETYYLSWTTEATATASVRATYNEEQRRWEYSVGEDYQVTYNLPPLPPLPSKGNKGGMK